MLLAEAGQASRSPGWATTAASASRSSRIPASSSFFGWLTLGPRAPPQRLAPARSRTASRAAGRAGRRRAGAPPAARASPPPWTRISRARTNASWRSVGALELEPDAVVEIALRLAEPLLEARPAHRPDPGRAAARRPGSRTPGRARAPCRAASPPRPAASASKQRYRRFVSRPSSRRCCSVSAVPIEATTGSNPACRSAITSVLPSTTTARSCFAIAGRARWRP